LGLVHVYLQALNLVSQELALRDSFVQGLAGSAQVGVEPRRVNLRVVRLDDGGVQRSAGVSSWVPIFVELCSTG